ncbi:MAG: DUF3667 domain-containing protein [Rhodanobacter sp.]
MKQLTSYEELHCANCGAAIQGEFCHDCGQSIHSVLKPVHGMLEDGLDLVLNVDGRVVHTLPPLFTRPGFLTLEYFAGRRMRYLAPFRLMFTLCLLAFFVSQLAFDGADFHLGDVRTANSGSFNKATTPAEVQQVLQREVTELDKARNSPGVPALAKTAMEAARHDLQRQASRRLTQLGAPPASDPADDPVHEPVPETSDWMNRSSPVEIGWLPAFANASLTRGVAHFKTNVLAMRGAANTRQEAVQRMLAGMFGVLPQTMFVLIPIFALLLKVFYIFKRRLYMEHLIVALHSHAFLFLNLLLSVLIYLLAVRLEPHAAWLGTALGWLQWGLWLWAPIYLLIMQKRVYRQGWPMTIVKYLMVGWCYSWLLLIALIIAGLLGMAQ